jgi:3-methyladenine DNA glycosylase AlkD
VLARYFQVKPGGYGEGDTFLGLKLSALRQLARPYLSRRFVPQEWLELLCSSTHEHRMAALVVMSERATRGAEAERREIYRTYLANTAWINNWDLVDVSCGAIVGGWLLHRDRTPLYDLARSPLLWERRIAVVSTQFFLRAGQSQDTYRLGVLLFDDPHDLMHKAVGWMLREAGKRVDAQELRRFLDDYAARLPRTALRYAIEHFGPEERKHYLSLR